MFQKDNQQEFYPISSEQINLVKGSNVKSHETVPEWNQKGDFFVKFSVYPQNSDTSVSTGTTLVSNTQYAKLG